MLGKYSVLMMLLLGTGSLVGISSIYTPANVETQPEAQQLQGRSIGIRIAPEDKQLLDRLMPSIIRGTVESKYFLDRLMQSLDSQTLTNKILPYLDISASVVQRPGAPTGVKSIGMLAGAESRGSTAMCNTGEIAIGGGMSFTSDPADSYVHRFGLTQPSPAAPQTGNGFSAGATFGDAGQIQAYVSCLTVKVGLKNVQQPQQPQQQQPSLPPGGPPLRPPPPVK